MRVNVNANNNEEIILSIGMIVKNEEKVIRRCLSSLVPLMNSIKCELIIADTGSVDATVSIAKEYTDNVFHFDWINDFSAARNATLNKAKGKWYMYLDADEYLDEDISEIVSFFKNKELYTKYKSMGIIIRSYFETDKKKYGDFTASRFYCIENSTSKIEFIGIIHESIPIAKPSGYFQTILHHTGYCYSSDNQQYEKFVRNITLLKEQYDNNPNDLRTLSQIIDATALQPIERKKYAKIALELARTSDVNYLYSRVVYLQIIASLNKSEPDLALQICEEYFEHFTEHNKYVATIGIVLLEAELLCGFSRYQEAYELYKKYFILFKNYEKNILDRADLLAHPINGLSKYEYSKAICAAAICLKECTRYDEALNLLDQFDINKLNGEEFNNYLGSIRLICKDSNNYSKMADIYYKIENYGDKNKIKTALYMMESSFYSIASEERRKFAEDVISSGISGKYVDLMKLYINQDKDDFSLKLIEFFESIENWDEGYSEAIYLAIKNKIDISKYVLNMNADFFRQKLETIAVKHDDFACWVLEYENFDSYCQSIKQFYWLVSLYEKASYRSFKLNDEKKMKLYSVFFKLLGDYVQNIYNPELLNDNDIDVLPVLHKFGYYMFKANDCKYSGDKVGYIRNMKIALINCESMKEIVQFMLDFFKKENNL